MKISRHDAINSTPLNTMDVFSPVNVITSGGQDRKFAYCSVRAVFRWRFAGSYTSASMDQLERLNWAEISYIV
jgi:hypothetical protein